jgi:hypothetical protein
VEDAFELRRCVLTFICLICVAINKGLLFFLELLILGRRLGLRMDSVVELFNDEGYASILVSVLGMSVLRAISVIFCLDVLFLLVSILLLSIN